MLVPFVRLSARIRTAPNGRISVKFVIVEFHENLSRLSKFLLQSDKNIGHFTRRPTYVLLFPATLRLHTSALWHGTSPIFLYVLRFLLYRLRRGAIFLFWINKFIYSHQHIQLAQISLFFFGGLITKPVTAYRIVNGFLLPVQQRNTTVSCCNELAN